MVSGHIVPPRQRARVVLGRPKARVAVKAAFAFALATLWHSLAHPQAQASRLALALPLVALAASLLAAVFRRFERPRKLTLLDPMPVHGSDVLYVRVGASRGAAL
jgi:hypothetical protein